MFPNFYDDLGDDSELSPAATSEKKTLGSCENSYWFPKFLTEGFPTEYNIEWKRYLLRKNSEEIKKSVSSKERFVFYTPKIVKSIFNLCKLFKQPPEVRYLAVDILDRFLVEHFVKVSETFDRMEKNGLHTWEAIVERMLGQSPLRVLTSVQLAMKYSWSCNIIKVSDIQEIMEFLTYGEIYSKRSILKSEARVYQHLNCDIVNKSPFTYLEMFFDDFHIHQTHKTFSLGIPLDDFFMSCTHVLDIAMIFHQKIYKALEEIRRQETYDNFFAKNHSTEPIKGDFVLLAAAVIFASYCLQETDADTSEVCLGLLCSIGECNKSDVEQLGEQILNVVRAN